MTGLLTLAVVLAAVLAACGGAWLLITAVIAATGGAIDADPGDDEPAEPAVTDCPDWCQAEHAVTLPHWRAVAELDTATAHLQVELSWWTPYSGPPAGEPDVHLVVLTDTAETVMTLTPVEAATLAAMLAVADGARLSGAIGAALADEAGWLAQALARAAALAGVSPCGQCGLPSEDVRPEYDRVSGEQVARCEACHSAALVGGEVQ